MSLLNAGWEVRGLSRSPKPDHLDEVEWMQGDITNAETVARAAENVTSIIHLACLPMCLCAQSPAHAVRVNIEGTLQILEAARKVGVERLIFTSSGQVYGGQSALPNSEINLPQPGSAYAASKLSAEMWCQTYSRLYGISVQILRLFNVYGLSVDGSLRSTVETLFLQQVRMGLRQSIYGNPQSGRDFIHIQDVVRAIMLALANQPGEGAINIGSGKLTTLFELAHLALQLHGKSIEQDIIACTEPAICFQADTRRAQASLFFQASITLENGLKELISYL